jgi:WD40 repeat protein
MFGKILKIWIMAIIAIILSLSLKAETLEDVAWMKLHNNDPTGRVTMSYSPNGEYIAHSALNHIAIYKASTGELVNIISGLPDCLTEGDIGLYTVAKFIDNTRIFVYAGEIRIYNAFTSEILERKGYPIVWEGIQGFSNDGKYALIIGEITKDNTYRLVIRDLKTWSTIYTDTMALTNESPYRELMYGFRFSDDNKYFSYFHELNRDTTYAIAIDLEKASIHFRYEFIKKKPFSIYKDTFISVINNGEQIIIDNCLYDVNSSVLLKKNEYPRRLRSTLEFSDKDNSFYCLAENELYEYNILYQLYKIDSETYEIIDSSNVFENQDLYIENPSSYKPFFIHGLILSPDEKTCLFIINAQWILYDIDNQKIINILSSRYDWHENREMKLFFTENNDLLFSITQPGISVWNTDEGDIRHIIDIQCKLPYGQDIEISKDGSFLLYTPKDYIGRNQTGVVSYDLLERSRSSISKNYGIVDFFLSKDNKAIAIKNESGEFDLDYVNDLETMNNFNIGKYQCDESTFVDFHPKRKEILFSNNYKIEIYNFVENKLLKTISVGTKRNVFIPNTEYIAGINYPACVVRIIDPLISDNNNKYNIVASFDHNGNELTDFCIDKSGRYLVTCSVDTTTKIWNIKTGEMIKEFKFSKFVPIRVAISNNSEYIATMDEFSNLIVWRTPAILSLDNTIENNVCKNDIHPNPATSQITLSLGEEFVSTPEIDIIDYLGNVKRCTTSSRWSPSEKSITINTSSLSPGVYFLRVRSGEKVEVRKFVVL